MASGGYGLFTGEKKYRAEHKFKDIGEVIEGAKQLKREQEPEATTRSIQKRMLEAMERNHLTSFERKVKMAREVPEEEAKKLMESGKYKKIQDDVVTVRFTKDVDMKETLDNNIYLGGTKYDKTAGTLISEASMEDIRKAVEEAHARGEDKVTVTVTMVYSHPGKTYENGELIPIERPDALQAIKDGNGLLERTKENENLYKMKGEDKYILYDPQQDMAYEAKKNGSLQYKMSKDQTPFQPQYVKDKEGRIEKEVAEPGYIGPQENGFKLSPSGNFIPKVKRSTATINLQYTLGMEVRDESGRPVALGYKRDKDGNIKTDEHQNPIKTEKIAGNSFRFPDERKKDPKAKGGSEQSEWDVYKNLVCRMEHVERYARDPNVEAIKSRADSVGRFVGNETVRTLTNRVVRAPFEASAQGDRELSKIASLLMQATRSR